MSVELVAIAVAVVLSVISEVALGALAAKRFRSRSHDLEHPVDAGQQPQELAAA